MENIRVDFSDKESAEDWIVRRWNCAVQSWSGLSVIFRVGDFLTSTEKGPARTWVVFCHHKVHGWQCIEHLRYSLEDSVAVRKAFDYFIVHFSSAFLHDCSSQQRIAESIYCGKRTTMGVKGFHIVNSYSAVWYIPFVCIIPLAYKSQHTGIDSINFRLQYSMKITKWLRYHWDRSCEIIHQPLHILMELTVD